MPSEGLSGRGVLESVQPTRDGRRVCDAQVLAGGQDANSPWVAEARRCSVERRTVDRVKAEPGWHGTAREAKELAIALANNCTCQLGDADVRAVACEAHAMAADQRILDRLLFARYMVARLLDEEFGLATAVWAPDD